MSNQNKINNTSQGFTKNLQKFSEFSMNLFFDSFEKNMKLAGQLGSFFKNKDSQFNPFPTSKSSSCCPPEPSCPPHCLLEIRRDAYVGEVIIVPFALKNKCNGEKRYRLGIRPMVDQNGNTSAIQPFLNKQEVTLQPGQCINVLMTVNLTQEVQVGDCFQAEIVIREAEINQNICFKLNILPFCDVPVACPLDEKEYLNQWQSWQSHFYCEKKPKGERLNEKINITGGK